MTPVRQAIWWSLKVAGEVVRWSQHAFAPVQPFLLYMGESLSWAGLLEAVESSPDYLRFAVQPRLGGSHLKAHGAVVPNPVLVLHEVWLLSAAVVAYSIPPPMVPSSL